MPLPSFSGTLVVVCVYSVRAQVMLPLDAVRSLAVIFDRIGQYAERKWSETDIVFTKYFVSQSLL